MNLDEKIVYDQPTTIETRAEVAEACVLHMNLQMPTLLDHMSNEVDLAYSALPERLYLIDEQGVIEWHSGMGPWGFDPNALGSQGRVHRVSLGVGFRRNK